jgi:pyrroline-5-carboxylate reductase
VRSYLSDFKNNIGKIALFGAGHMGCTFVNLLQLQNLVDFFVDDNPDKAGLYMPGSRLPIYPSSALLGREIKLCLLSLNPAIEEKVIQKNRAFLDAGGRFVSIFPGSNNALKV